MTLSTIAPTVRECADRATFTQYEYDDALEFSASMGDVRYIVSASPEETLTVSYSERLEPPYVVIGAHQPDPIERYLLKVFGSRARNRMKYRRVRLPADEAEIADGYSLGTTDWHGERRIALVDQDERLIAWGAREPIIDTANMATLSHLMAVSLDDLTRSYLNPFGAPALSQFLQS